MVDIRCWDSLGGISTIMLSKSLFARLALVVIVENAIALQLIQTDFDKFYTNYQKAISKIIYSQVNSSSSTIEQGYKQIVDSFTSNNGIVFNSLKVLINILDNSFQQN